MQPCFAKGRVRMARQPAVRRKGHDPKKFDMAVTVSVILCVMAAAMAAVGGHIYESRGQSEALQVDMIIEETSRVTGAYAGTEASHKPGYVQTEEADIPETVISETAAETEASYKSEYVRTEEADIPETVISETEPAARETGSEAVHIPDTAVGDVGDGGNALVDINTASAEELEGLDGIGEKLAQAIIDYRSVKPFDTIEEIMQVKGIGEKRYEKIKDSITC